ncbi:hypothetical protein Tco_0144813 [Tanacetum coccineum]
MTNIVPAPPTDPPKALDESRVWGILILFGAIPAIIPIILEVPIVPADPIVALEVGTFSVISPTGVLDLVDYSSSSDSDPSEDSLPPVPDLPLVSPFLCSDDSEADSESEPAEQRPERHESLTPSSEFPLAPVVAPTQDSSTASDSCPTCSESSREDCSFLLVAMLDFGSLCHCLLSVYFAIWRLVSCTNICSTFCHYLKAVKSELAESHWSEPPIPMEITATYSASAEDIAVQFCFFDIQSLQVSSPRNCYPSRRPFSEYQGQSGMIQRMKNAVSSKPMNPLDTRVPTTFCLGARGQSCLIRRLLSHEERGLRDIFNSDNLLSLWLRGLTDTVVIRTSFPLDFFKLVMMDLKLLSVIFPHYSSYVASCNKDVKMFLFEGFLLPTASAQIDNGCLEAGCFEEVEVWMFNEFFYLKIGMEFLFNEFRASVSTLRYAKVCDCLLTACVGEALAGKHIGVMKLFLEAILCRDQIHGYPELEDDGTLDKVDPKEFDIFKDN